MKLEELNEMDVVRTIRGKKKDYSPIRNIGQEVIDKYKAYEEIITSSESISSNGYGTEIASGIVVKIHGWAKSRDVAQSVLDDLRKTYKAFTQDSISISDNIEERSPNPSYPFFFRFSIKIVTESKG